MKLSIFFQILGMSLCLGYLHTQPVTAQNLYNETAPYTIQKGETTYRIAKNHGITVEQLLALNPGMKPEHIQANMVINVPAHSLSTASHGRTATAIPSVKVQASAKSHQEPQDSIIYKKYKIKRKDTAYSLAKANGITVDELMRANPQLAENGYKLKKGKTIQIPIKIKRTIPLKKGLDTLRVAVILPFIGNNDENIRSIEFYQGILMGIEELKNAKKCIVVSAYNEPKVNENISGLMRQVCAKRPDVIVGPLYPTHFTDVSNVASYKTKVAIPFSSKVQQVDTNPNVYAFNTPVSYRNEIGIELFISSFKKDVNIIFLHKKDGDKKEFCSLLQSAVIKNGYNLTSLSASCTADEIKKAIAGRNGKNFVVVPDDSSIETLKTLMPKMEYLRKNMTNNNFSLLGFSPWIELSEGEFRQKFHETDIYILAPNYYFPYTTAAMSFTSRYQRWFKSDILKIYPRMAPLGYDFSIGFLGGMANHGYDFGSNSPLPNTVAAMPKLQNEMRFVKANDKGGYVSRSMWLVHFKKDMTITKTNAK